MGSINITINQFGLPPGVPGESRDDLILTSPEIFLTNYNPTGLIITTWLWELISVPEGSPATILDANTDTAHFTADNFGSYLIQLTINKKIKKRIIATVKTDILDLTLVANKEDREINGWSSRLNDSLKKLEGSSCGASCIGTCANTCLGDCAGSCTDDCSHSCSNTCACSCSSTCASVASVTSGLIPGG